MEFKSFFEGFKGKSNKIITFILIGILLLVIAMPVKNRGLQGSNTDKNTYGKKEDSLSKDEYACEYKNNAAYYEEKLKKILEKSYGNGSMNVMVSMKAKDNGSDFYMDDSYEEEFLVDGVLIVADVSLEEAADIAFAVCALFNLPAHKVAVLIKK